MHTSELFIFRLQTSLSPYSWRCSDLELLIMHWWPRLAPLLCPASYRAHTCTTHLILHYMLRYGIAVHVSMFSSALVRMMTSPTDCELDVGWSIQTVHLHCRSILLYNYKAHQNVYFEICLLFSLYYKLLNVTTSYMYICTRVLLFIIILIITSFLRTFYNNNRH